MTKVNSMSAAQVTEYILGNKPLFILDVRNEDDFRSWKIEGKHIQAINVPYFDLLDGVEGILDQIPDEQPVLVVCAKEGSSIFVAEQLLENGKSNVSYLVGGMKSWSEHVEPVKVGNLQDGALYQFVRIGKGCLSYMIVSNGEAIIVDSARMISAYTEFADKNNIKIKHLIDTHLHADHLSGGRELAEKVSGTYWLPPKDAEEVSFDYSPLDEGKEISVGGTTLTVTPIYSPGHTIGSTTLIVDDKYLLTGDILFVDSIGRPDLAGKAEDWVEDLRTTLYSTYKELSEDLIVLPAHFAKMTELSDEGTVSARLGELYKVNAALNAENEDLFRTMVTNNLPPQPNAYQEIRQSNIGKLNPSEDEQRDMELGPNRCAIH
ncbi:MBL fold metallo-hydrolase [Paenibacillus alginolyticus]|uniref:MBL fold metallo-hydrolase n=1 Tax=Paenibacillus alginolyticus TaxID=59839 RepID=A0ABT4GMX6_9BACL|nr:MBL fold metallo-hydrolase [Paenibacillus alginolyticus]MCY9697577.1 MBL fold metallo-hydrolase [Paenibacillus alginolyticus]MEC0143355.1 MBL fold metallo-hydrolase [Paenibacillus alginolyticus]